MNQSIIHYSHDTLFKLFMQDKLIAKEFIEAYLPDEVKATCDLNSLSLESGSFVEPTLTQRYNDILYSMNTTHGKGYVYCLIEHQSKPDNMISWRLFRYAIMAMDKHLKQRHNKLPLVIPLLFYCGKKPHPHSISMNWLAHFEQPEMAMQTYTNSFKLVDINMIEDSELLQHKRIGILEYLFKHIHTRDLLLMVEQICQFIISGLHSQEQIKSLLLYSYNQSRIEQP